MNRTAFPRLCSSFSLSLVLLSALSASDAAAQSGSASDAPNAELSTQARQAFEAGVAAFDTGEFAVAADQFGRAQALIPHPDVLLNLAQSELKAGRYPEAATHFSTYLRDASPHASALATTGFSEAKRQVAEVTLQAPRDLKLAVDGMAVGVAPLAQPLFLAPGTHQLTAGQVSRSVTLLPGTSDHVNLTPGDTSPVSAPVAEHRTGVVEWFTHSPAAWAGVGLTGAGLVLSVVSSVTASNRYEQADKIRDQILAHYATEKHPLSSPCGPPALSGEYDRACHLYSTTAARGTDWKTVSLVSLMVAVAAAGGTVAYYFADQTYGGSHQAFTAPTLNASVNRDSWSVSVQGRF